jgi:hypothetical protein
MGYQNARDGEKHRPQPNHARQSYPPGKLDAGTVGVILRKVMMPLFPNAFAIVKIFVIHHFWEYSETFSQIIERGIPGKV